MSLYRYDTLYIWINRLHTIFKPTVTCTSDIARHKKSVYVFYELIFEFQVKLKRIDEHILNDRHVTLNRSKQEGVISSNKYWYCMHVIWNVIYVTERRLLMIFILYLIVKFIIKQEYLDKIMNLFCSTNTR